MHSVRAPRSANKSANNNNNADNAAAGEGEGRRGRRPRRRERRPNPTRVFMGGVPQDCDLAVIQAKFPKAVKGSVKNQVAFVFFDSVESADAALELHGQDVRRESGKRGREKRETERQ